MANVFIWNGQLNGGGDVVCLAAESFGFYGSAYPDTIAVGSYQDSSHVVTTTPGDKCVGTHLNNNKWTLSDEMSINGAASTPVENMTEAQAVLEVHYDVDPNCSVQNAQIRACYSTGQLTTAPEDMTVQVLEQGDTAWNAASHSSPVQLTDKPTPAADHYWYVAVSVSPSAAGEQTANAILYVDLEYY